MTQNGLPIARPTPNTSQLSCESSCRWTVSDTVLGWGSRPLVFFARYLAGRLERPAVLPCVAQTGVVSPVGGDQAHGITRGVSFRVRGQSSPHRATQRLSAGRARDHPVMEIVPNKALSLSLSLCKSCQCAREVFGLWRVCFPPCLVRPGRRLPVQGLSEGSLGFRDRLPA